MKAHRDDYYDNRLLWMWMWLKIESVMRCLYHARAHTKRLTNAWTIAACMIRHNCELIHWTFFPAASVQMKTTCIKTLIARHNRQVIRNKCNWGKFRCLVENHDNRLFSQSNQNQTANQKMMQHLFESFIIINDCSFFFRSSKISWWLHFGH